MARAAWSRLVKQGDESFEVPGAHYPKRMKPIAEKAVDGRVNPKGIVCLYLATEQETAVLETRPLIGSDVSVAQFETNKDVRLIDCSRDHLDSLKRLDYLVGNEAWTLEAIEKAVWSDINHAFAKPARRGDDSLDYVPTQILSEVFKHNGFDGIAYKSSYGEKGFNIALFDTSVADLINCGLHRVDDIRITMSEHDQYFVTENGVVRNVITAINGVSLS
jgi:hypothetical protein